MALSGAVQPSGHPLTVRYCSCPEKGKTPAGLGGLGFGDIPGKDGSPFAENRLIILGALWSRHGSGRTRSHSFRIPT